MKRLIAVLMCRFGMHDFKQSHGTCSDGWVWVTHVCSKCGAFKNPFMAADVALHNERRCGDA